MKTKQTWENKFDKKFTRKNAQTGKREERWFVRETTTALDLKDFIKALILKEREEAVGEVLEKVGEAMKLELADTQGGAIPRGEYKDGYLMGYSDAKETLNDLLAKLESIKKEVKG